MRVLPSALLILASLGLCFCGDDDDDTSPGAGGSAGSTTAGAAGTSAGLAGVGGAGHAGTGGLAGTGGAGAAGLSGAAGASAGGPGGSGAAGKGVSGSSGQSGTAGTGGSAGSAGGGAGGAAGSAGDPCAGALLCESFDGYDGVTTLADKQTIGPWHAALKTPGGSMDLDTKHVTSGKRALHMHIDKGATAGGRLFADSGLPALKTLPTHIYGRMKMYIDPNGTSVHWTFFGASGDAEPSSPEKGRRATYLMSSLPTKNANTFSLVYGLNAKDPDPFHDCYQHTSSPMPTATWTCVAFEMDSVKRKLRTNTDGNPTPVASVDDHGQGCVGDVVPDDAPWYGPAIDQLYVGAWSFHAMDNPLDVWIDDLVVDTKPVTCPAP